MASILDFLNTDKGKKFIDSSSKELDESPEKVKSALGMALPMMLGAMKKNASSDEGAESINKALDDNKHDGSVLNNLGGLLSGGGVGSLLSEGSGILNNIFGGKQDKIEEAVGSSTGMDSSKIAKLLKMAAPVVLGILGSQKRKDNVDKGGISGLLGSVMGSNTSHDQSLLETFMDSGSDNNVLSNAAGKIFGGKGDSKSLGDFFKG